MEDKPKQDVHEINDLAADEDPFVDASQIIELEEAVAEAEKTLGPDSPELASILMKYAAAMRHDPKRLLEAANVEARAKAIRAKIYAGEEEKLGLTEPAIKPTPQERNRTGTYIGLAAMALAACGFFVDQQWSCIIFPLCILLAVVDVIMSGGQWWRAFSVCAILTWTWYGITCIPSYILTESTPMERLDFEANNPTLLSNIKKLGLETQFMVYGLRLPGDYALSTESNNKPEWGRAFSWIGPPREDNTAPQLAVMSMTIPDDIRKKLAHYSLIKLAREVALPNYLDWLGISDPTTDFGQDIEINGREYAIVRWSGTITDDPDNERMRGFIYVTRGKSTLVAIGAADKPSYADQTLDPLEAIPYTFHKNQPGESEI
jgi:hypothetical protein